MAESAARLGWASRRNGSRTTWPVGGWALISESSGGVYVNYVGADATTAMVRAAYGANFQRLLELKRRHDPMNIFRHNVNINPLQSGNP